MHLKKMPVAATLPKILCSLDWLRTDSPIGQTVQCLHNSALSAVTSATQNAPATFPVPLQSTLCYWLHPESVQSEWHFPHLANNSTHRLAMLSKTASITSAVA